MTELKTWRTKPRALTPRQLGPDTFTLLVPAAATPTTVPLPRGDLSAAPVEQIVAAAESAWDDWATKSGDRSVALRLLLGHLEGFAGRSWQDRWLTSGLDDPGRPVRVLQPPRAAGRTIHRAFEALLCLRVIRPNVAALRSNRLSTFAEAFRVVHDDLGLDEFFDRAAQAEGPAVYRRRAVFDVCCVLTTQGIVFDDLTAEAFLHYADSAGCWSTCRTPRARATSDTSPGTSSTRWAASDRTRRARCEQRCEPAR